MSVTFWNMQHFAVGNYSWLCMSSFTIPLYFPTLWLLSVLEMKPFVMSHGALKVLDLHSDTLPFSFTPSKHVALLPKHLFREEAANKGLKVPFGGHLKYFSIHTQPVFFLYYLLAVLLYWFGSEQSIDPLGISSYLMMQPVSRGPCWGSISRLSLSEVGEALPKRFIPVQAGRIDSSSACVNKTLYAALCRNNGSVISQVLLPNARRSAASKTWHHQRMKAQEPRTAPTDAAAAWLPFTN